MFVTGATIDRLCGNPSGRPKEDQTITELARAYCPRAIEVLGELMNDAKATASARVMAAERILDRAYGKPAQFQTNQAGEFKKAIDMTDDELAAIVAAGRSKVLELVKPVTPGATPLNGQQGQTTDKAS
jgi:hypothetical protein